MQTCKHGLCSQSDLAQISFSRELALLNPCWRWPYHIIFPFWGQ